MEIELKGCHIYSCYIMNNCFLTQEITFQFSRIVSQISKRVAHMTDGLWLKFNHTMIKVSA